MSQLSAVVRDAMSTAPTANEAASRIHEIAARTIRELDPALALQSTGYFNHSWAPDFVAKWRNGDEREREIFLRFDIATAAFADELKLLGRADRMFVGLDDSTADGVETPAESDTLVAAGDALEVLARGTDAHPTLRPATSALVRGGRGVIKPADCRRARNLISHARRADTARR
jgi:hypothetical protein